MLMPKKVKYRKQQRGRMSRQSLARLRAVVRRFWLEGDGAGLDHRPADRSQPRGHDPFHQARRKIWIRLFPDKPVTKKPAETRMGKGKGAPDHWVAVVRPGKILFEMEGVTPTEAQEAMRLASHKLPAEHQVRDARDGTLETQYA